MSVAAHAQDRAAVAELPGGGVAFASELAALLAAYLLRFLLFPQTWDRFYAPLYVLVVADFKGFSEFGFIAGTGILLALVSMTVIRSSSRSSVQLSLITAMKAR